MFAASAETYTYRPPLSLHVALPISLHVPGRNLRSAMCRDATFLGTNPFAHYIRPMTNFRLHQPGIVGAGRVAQALALALRPHAIAPPMLWEIGRAHV